MISSLRAAYSQLQALPSTSREMSSVYTGPRDEAIRTAFAAFDTPAHVRGDSRDRGVHVDAIDDHLKCIFGMPHDASMIGPRVTQYIASRDGSERSAPHALSVSRLTALAAFYIGLCQERAFNAEATLDTDGLIDFVVARIGMPKDALKQSLTDSTLGACVFMSMRRSMQAPALAIYEAQGHDLCAPSPSLQFGGVPNAPFHCRYLRNVTISMQTLRGVDLTSADLSGAYIDNTDFGCVSFSHTDLSSVVFSDIHAVKCCFVGANLAHATFLDSRLSDLEFKHCKMASINIHATALQNTRFEQCDLRDMVVDNASHVRAGMRSIIDKSEFRGCDMTGARFSHLRWSDGAFIDSQLAGATISDSVFLRSTWRHPLTILMKPPLSGAKFSDVQLHDCTMRQLNADESEWINCSFEKGSLVDASWRDTTLCGMRFAAVDMLRMRFDNAQCQRLRIEAMCDLDGVSFASAKMRDVRFDGVHSRTMLRLNCTDFSATDLEDVHFMRCQMISTQFPFTQMRGVKFARCNLNYADFTSSVGGDLMGTLMANRMKHYRAEGMLTSPGDIGSLSTRTRRIALLNHIGDRDCLLANVLTGSSGTVIANIVLELADKLVSEADDPADSDACMIAALSQAYSKIPLDADARTRIDVHLCRMLQRHLPELNDREWRTRPENRWGLDAVEHVRRLLSSQREYA